MFSCHFLGLVELVDFEHPTCKGKSIISYWAFAILGIIRHYTDKQICNKNLSSVNLSNCQGGIFYFTVTFLPFLMINPLALPSTRCPLRL